MSDDNEWKLPWDGGCRCGETRIRITKLPFLTNACHCSGCQKMSASAFSLTIIVPSDGFEVTAGSPVFGGATQDQHHFCPSCKSWMFTRIKGMDWFVNVRPSMLDEHGWFVPFAETFTSEKLPWATTPARRSYPTFPDMNDFEPLMAEFAKEGARP